MILRLNKTTEEPLPTKQPPLEEAADRLRSFLRARRLRLTSERMALMRVALDHQGHFDAEEMVSRLRRGRNKVSRATIYRTLAILEECGILRKSLIGQGRGLYERAIGRTPHDHLVCASCGAIQELFDDRIDSMQREIASNSGYEVQARVCEFVGLCPACRTSRLAGVKP